MPSPSPSSWRQQRRWAGGGGHGARHGRVLRGIGTCPHGAERHTGNISSQLTCTASQPAQAVTVFPAAPAPAARARVHCLDPHPAQSTTPLATPPPPHLVPPCPAPHPHPRTRPHRPAWSTIWTGWWSLAATTPTPTPLSWPSTSSGRASRQRWWECPRPSTVGGEGRARGLRQGVAAAACNLCSADADGKPIPTPCAWPRPPPPPLLRRRPQVLGCADLLWFRHRLQGVLREHRQRVC